MRLLSARAYLFEGRSYYNQGRPQKPSPRSMKARRAVRGRAAIAPAKRRRSTAWPPCVSDREDIARGREDVRGVAGGERIDRRSPRRVVGAQQPRHPAQGSRRVDEARKTHERSLALRREIADRNWIAISLNNIGVVLFEQDQFREASKYYKESLAAGARARRQAQPGPRPAQPRDCRARSRQSRGGTQGDRGIARDARGDWRQARADHGPRRARHEPAGTGRTGAAPGRTRKRRSRSRVETKLVPGEAQGHYPARRDCARRRRLRGSPPPARTRAASCGTTMKETRTIVESQVALANVALEEGRLDDAGAHASRASSNHSAGARTPMLAAAKLIAARDPAGSQRRRRAPNGSSPAVRAQARQTERISLRSQLALVEAAADIIRGQTEARQDAARRPARRVSSARACRSPSSNGGCCACGSIVETPRALEKRRTRPRRWAGREPRQGAPVR